MNLAGCPGSDRRKRDDNRSEFRPLVSTAIELPGGKAKTSEVSLAVTVSAVLVDHRGPLEPDGSERFASPFPGDSGGG